MRRRSFAAIATIAAGSTAAACSSSNKFESPSGDWQRDNDGDLIVAIPKDWDKSNSEDGTWTTYWTDPKDKSNILMTARRVDEDDVYAALDTAADSARSVSRGYQLVGECIACLMAPPR